MKHVFKPAKIVLLFCMLAASLMLFPPPGVNAQETALSKVADNGYASLVSKAENQGTVRIIVGIAGQSGEDPALPEKEALVKRAALSTAQEDVVSELTAKGLKPQTSHKYDYIPYMAMTVDRATLDALLASSKVESIEEDILFKASADSAWNMGMIGADTLHASGVTGNGVAVAILDTGVASGHPYLSGAVVSEACYSTNGVNYGSSSVCPGGVSSCVATGCALPYAGNCPTAAEIGESYGACDHGTHVAGIAAGRDGVDGSPGPGVAPQAKIIAIQVFSRFDNNPLSCGNNKPCVLAWYSDIAKGMERVYALKDSLGYKVAAVNLSLGGGTGYKTTSACDSEYKSQKAIIDKLRAAGIATIIASGNEKYCGKMSAPACISSAVSVGATTPSDAVGDYSNSASFLSLLAPGGEYATGAGVTSSVPGGGYESWYGTSMAAPHVTGAWALLKKKYPLAAVSEILNVFKATGTSITDTKGWCAAPITKKRINVADAYNKGILVVNIAGTKKGTVAADGLECASGSKKCLGAYTSGETVTITATPTGSLSFPVWSGCTSSSGAVCSVTVDSIVKVTVTFTGPPNISVVPTPLNFGKVKGTGPYASKKVKITNTGAGMLTVGTVDITSTASSVEFTVTANTCTSPIAKGKTCTISVAPAPEDAETYGMRIAQLNIASDDPDKLVAHVKLKANVAPPKITAPRTVAFGGVKTTAPLQKTIYVKNTGVSDLFIGTITQDGDSEFDADFSACSGTTLVRGTNPKCPIIITFSPGTKGATYTGHLYVPSNDQENSSIMITLTGKGK